jgi:hypothetical protein
MKVFMASCGRLNAFDEFFAAGWGVGRPVNRFLYFFYRFLYLLLSMHDKIGESMEVRNTNHPLAKNMKKTDRKITRLNAIPAKRLMIVLAAALILSAAGAAGDEPVTAPKDTGFPDVPLENLAAQFREIRKIKGHFDGGTWNDDVDHWEGRKHRLMMELGIRLSTGKYQKSDIIRLLEPPDQIARKGDELYRRITELPGNITINAAPVEYLLYYWRGTHDFLYFTCRDDALVDSGWWYAME